MMQPVNQRLEIGFLPFFYDFEHKFSKKDAQIKSKVNEISNKIEESLFSKQSFEKFACGYVSQIFEFRLLAFQWFLDKKMGTNDLLSVFQDFEENLEKAKTKISLSELIDNTHFAIRTNIRVINKFSKLMPNDESFEDMLTSGNNAFKLPPMNYESFLYSLYVNVPPNEYEKIVGWVNSSVLLETSLITCFIILEKELKISNSKINQLSKFIAKSTQEYGAYAMQLGIFSNKNIQFGFESFSNDIVKEEKKLSEQGILEYLAIL